MLTGCGGTPKNLTNTIVPTTPFSTNETLSTQEYHSYWPTEGWRTSTPEEQGMESEKLVAMMNVIQSEEPSYNIDSITIIRNGYMIFDTTFYPFKPDTKHIIHSCTKSIVSALVGIAIEQGHIENVQQPILDFFPDRTAANLTTEKKTMTLEDFLMVTTLSPEGDSFSRNARRNRPR